MKRAANKLGAVNGGTALLVHVEHCWPAVTDPERSPKLDARVLT
jgi:hypothetical protein